MYYKKSLGSKRGVMKDKKISIYIVEDYKLSRMCIKQVLLADGFFDIYGDFETAEEVLECLQHKPSDLVVMDIGLKGMDGVLATGKIYEKHKDTKVVIYTSHNNRKEIYLAFKMGAHGYFLKENNPLLLPLILKSVYNSMVCIDHTVSKSIISRGTSDMIKGLNNLNLDISKLTEEDIEMMKCIGRGESNIAIAKKFMISPNTAKSRVSKLTQKLNAQDRVQIAVIAAKCNLV